MERAGPRLPGLVLLAVVTALAVLCGAVALTSRASSPPSIAEIAPTAVEQIKQELDDQAAEVTPGELPPDATPTPSSAPSPTSGPGASAGPSVSPGTTSPDEVPRVRQCVGTPPRQTEDPQSAPCVPFFDPEQDNGGATAPGVTADSITIALPQQFLEDASIPPLLAEFFNTRYEFYGRKLVLRAFAPGGCREGRPDPAGMRADAVAVQEELQAFASLAYCNAQGADQYYYDALAERRVISVPDGNLVTGTEAAYTARRPYQWNVLPGTDVQLASTAQFACSTLVGRRPAYAGAAQAQVPSRKLGVIYTRAADGTAPDLGPLRRGLQSCGVEAVEVREDANGDPSRTGVGAVVTLRDAGVTSVICLCSVVDTRSVYMAAASAQGYQPEWVVGTYGGNDLDNSFSSGNAPPDQVNHIIGLTFRSKFRPKQDMPWYQAVREVSPQSDPQGNVYYASNSRYQQLLLLAAGIQLAGPRLTAEAFETALQRARFPNPGAGTAPAYQARVGFEGRRHVMTDDAAMIWFAAERPGTVDPRTPGAVCYVDRGRRTGLGEWKRAEPAFYSGPCA